MSAGMSSEEYRRQMNFRFDAVNKESEKRRQMRRDSSAIKDVEENKRRSKREVNADDASEMGDMGENDSGGG